MTITSDVSRRSYQYAKLEKDVRVKRLKF